MNDQDTNHNALINRVIALSVNLRETKEDEGDSSTIL